MKIIFIFFFILQSFTLLDFSWGYWCQNWESLKLFQISKQTILSFLWFEHSVISKSKYARHALRRKQKQWLKCVIWSPFMRSKVWRIGYYFRKSNFNFEGRNTFFSLNYEQTLYQVSRIIFWTFRFDRLFSPKNAHKFKALSKLKMWALSKTVYFSIKHLFFHNIMSLIFQNQHRKNMEKCLSTLLRVQFFVNSTWLSDQFCYHWSSIMRKFLTVMSSHIFSQNSNWDSTKFRVTT